MGLSLEVGILADLKDNDADGFAYWQKTFARVNVALATAGLPAHQEPEKMAEPDAVWSGDMFSYSGLHHLRRLAAHLAESGGLPLPVKEDNPSKDPAVARYYERATATERPGGLLARLFGKKPLARAGPGPFDHLMLHSDAEGLYLPLDFPEVIFPEDALEIPGAMIGSAPRLLSECRRLALALGIPDGLDAEADELIEAIDSRPAEGELWKRHPIATHACVQLIAGCEAACADSAALVFC